MAPQPFTLLRTNFHTPQVRGEWVRRPRLETRLKRGMDRRFTLVSAPVGFGKSSLVASALSESERHDAWLSLDEGDNDPVRFWAYVIAAIQTFRTFAPLYGVSHNCR
jgi:LuxR family maltose regulon positive regulatory protein